LKERKSQSRGRELRRRTDIMSWKRGNLQKEQDGEVEKDFVLKNDNTSSK